MGGDDHEWTVDGAEFDGEPLDLVGLERLDLFPLRLRVASGGLRRVRADQSPAGGGLERLAQRSDDAVA